MGRHESEVQVSETDTPRVDCQSVYNADCEQWVNINFARQLERELAAMTKERDALKANILQIHKDLGCEMRDPNGTIWQHCAEVTKERDQLKARVEELEREGEWHPVSDKPKVFDCYLTSNRDGGLAVYDFGKDWEGDDVAFWRELPAAPNEPSAKTSEQANAPH